MNTDTLAEEELLKERVLTEARSLACFWPDCDRGSTQQRLQQTGVPDGTYILRCASDVDVQNGKILTLSVKKTYPAHRTKVWHFPVIAEVTADGRIVYYIASTQKRDTLQGLLDYHRTYPLRGQPLPEACHMLQGLPYEKNKSESFISVDYSSAEETTQPKPNARAPKPMPRSPNTPKKKPLPDIPQFVTAEDTKPLLNRQIAIVSDPDEKCHCGLPLKCTQLPKNWTVHRSNREDATKNMLYFMDPSGHTAWQLHPEIDEQCTNRDYLKYGRLNILNFRKYEIDYVETSDLRLFDKYDSYAGD